MKLKTVIAIAASVGAVTALAAAVIIKKHKKLGFCCCDSEDYDDFCDDDCCEDECCCGGCHEEDLDVAIPSEEYDDADLNLDSTDDFDDKPKNGSDNDKSSNDINEV